MSERGQHISLDRLLDLARGDVPGAEQQAIRSHTASCASCAAQLARITRIVAVARDDISEEVPRHVVARAVRLMRQRTVVAPDLRRRIVATLRFDSARSAGAVGRRSGLAGARQLVFETGLYDIDVRIRPAGAQWTIWGQVLGDVAGGQAALAGPATAQAEISGLGEFRLPPVPSGAYALTLHLDEVEISMELIIEG